MSVRLTKQQVEQLKARVYESDYVDLTPIGGIRYLREGSQWVSGVDTHPTDRQVVAQIIKGMRKMTQH